MNNYNIFLDFKKYISEFILQITTNKILNLYLYKSTIKDMKLNKNIYHPLVFVLGGASYNLYQDIFKYNGLEIDSKYNVETEDYDICMSLKNHNNLDLFEKEFKKEFNLFKNSFILKKYNLTGENISFIKKHNNNNNSDRLWYQINVTTSKNKSFHIMDLSFWKNGKVSDVFTINDFRKLKIYLFNYNNINYYLIPLDKLVRSTFLALTNFFIRKNHNKCIKCMNRIKMIKKFYIKYTKLNINNKILKTLLGKYENSIHDIYKIALDYPYLLSIVALKNKPVKNNFDCYHNKLRINNFKKLSKLTLSFKECENETEEQYETVDTEEMIN